AGAGGIGDSIGMVDTRCMAGLDTIPRAERFITATTSIAADPADRGAAAPSVVEYSTIPVARPSLSRATGRRPADTPLLADKAAHAPARSAVTTMAVKPGAIRPAANPALVAVAGSTAAAVVVATLAAAGVVELNPRTNAMTNDGNDDQIQPTHPTNSRSMSRSRVRDVSAGLKSWRWRSHYAANESEL